MLATTTQRAAARRLATILDTLHKDRVRCGQPPGVRASMG